ITERKKAELMLRESEERFRSLVEQSLVGVYIIQEGRFIYVNPEMARIFGYEPEEIINKKTPYDLTAEDFHPTVKENIRRRLEGETKSVYYMFKGKKKDGTLIDVEVLGTVTEMNNRPAIIGTIKDITEHVQIEREKEAQRRFLQSIIDSLPDQVMVIRPDYRVELVNTTLNEAMKSDTFCYSISHGRDLPCEGSEHPCPLKEVMEKKKVSRTIHEHLKPDGSKMVVEIIASPVFNEKGEIIYVIEASRDITERVRLEEENRKLMERLYLEEKEQSIITLTGGIAHDFNNMLMAVLGSAELLRIKARKEDLSYIDNIIRYSERMTDLVKQMLAYSGQGIYQPSNLDLNTCIENALKMTHKGKYLNIRVDLDLDKELWPVFADRSQMEQMMINLTLNAFEAMAETGGILSIRTSNIKITENRECYPLKQYLSEGEYVEIRVSDSGPGIPEALHKKIFDPFFTTKFMGRGLGLPAVAGIVKSHNGCLHLESGEGKGTTFTIYLPRAAEEITKEPVIRRQGRGILIVDDDETVLNLLNDALSGAGYDVYAATEGSKAINKFNEIREEVGLAIIDIEMPGMNGKELIGELRKVSKDLKMVISSGYDEDTALRGIEPRPDGFIQKPYRLSILLSKVKEFIP
ncbi:MAG: PAS domain S-box protein, partial [Thermodesulfovibrionales bacterium]